MYSFIKFFEEQSTMKKIICENEKCQNAIKLANGDLAAKNVEFGRYRCCECNITICPDCFNERSHPEHFMVYRTTKDQPDFEKYNGSIFNLKNDENFGINCVKCCKEIRGFCCVDTTDSSGNRNFYDLECFRNVEKIKTAVNVQHKAAADISENALNGIFKVFPQKVFPTQEGFNKEREALHAIRSENIIKMVACSTAFKTVVYEPTDSLAVFLERDLSHCSLLLLAKGICDGLKAMHMINWSHCNLSIESVVISSNLIPMITNFEHSTRVNKDTIISSCRPELVSENWYYDRATWWDLDLNHLGFLLNLIFGGVNNITMVSNGFIRGEITRMAPGIIQAEGEFATPIEMCFIKGCKSARVAQGFLKILTEIISIN